MARNFYEKPVMENWILLDEEGPLCTSVTIDGFSSGDEDMDMFKNY